MTHARLTVEEVSAYLDGELAEDERAMVDSHIATCASCTSLVRTWRDAGRALVVSSRRAPSIVGRRLIALASLVVLLAGASVALAAGPFGILQLIPRPTASATASRVTTVQPLSAADLRAQASVPLPVAGELADGWTEHGATTSGGGVELEYTKAGVPGSVSVAVFPLAARPALIVSGLRTETVTLGDTTVVVLYGDEGPVASPPPNAVVDREALAHRMRAAFEWGTAAVVINADDRTISRAALLSLVAAWMLKAPR